MDKQLTPADQQVLNDIEQYGAHIVDVLAEGSTPGFGFSIGLFHNFKHPEILIIGLQQELIHSIINDVLEEVKKGKRYEAFTYSPNILEGFECYFTPVKQQHYQAYLGYAHWFYKGDDFPVLQCIYPTVKGIYPWQDAWPQKLKTVQPILGPINI